MKSAHRHDLQTNALAKRLDVAINSLRPYVSTVALAIVAIALLMLVWTYISNSSAARHGEAWDAFNQAVGSAPPDLNKLHQSAQEYPQSKMQELADITWADGQVFMATENYLYNRRSAKESLDRAAPAYQGVLQTSTDKRLLNRAHLGLARVYEMRNELEKARDEYLKVDGGYAEYAKFQAKRLEDPESKETYAWLAKAEPPRIQRPIGPGTPGKRPDFSAGDFPLPGATPDGGAPSETDPAASFDDLLKGLRELPSVPGTRYGKDEQTPPLDGSLPGTNTDSPSTSETPPATNGETPATGDGTSAADDSATSSSTEKRAVRTRRKRGGRKTSRVTFA